MTSAGRQLCQCAKDGDLAGVMALLAAGTGVDARDPDTGRTALMEAAASSCAGLDMVRRLIESGANVNASTFDGLSANRFSHRHMVGRFIYVIGSLGYQGRRMFGQTQVYRLDIRSLAMEAVETSGDKPGWIHGHRTDVLEDGWLCIRGGKICVMENDTEVIRDNPETYVLDLTTMNWRRSED